MATLEDRILGEKLQYYCSSSEDEDDNNSSKSDRDYDNYDESENSRNKHCIQNAAVDCRAQELRPWEGTSTNTGPKGVMKDWRSYKQMEAEQRKEKEQELRNLAKKLTLTCRSHLDDEKEKAAAEKNELQCDELDPLDAAVLEAYISQRMREMVQQATLRNGKTFGIVIDLLATDEFLKAVDEEDDNVTIIVHLYRKSAPGCEAVSGCLRCLAVDYKHVKFCELSAATAGLSQNFVGTGVPALLVYKGGAMIANFVRITDSLGDDFYACDLESFLVEHAVLPDRTLIPSACIKSSQGSSNSDDE